MDGPEVIDILKNKIKFSDNSINKLKILHESLLSYNNKYNLIAKSTENQIWERHILDSAQIIQLIDKSVSQISDFGSGAGFPGIILSIFDENKKFHVKLYEKSLIKRKFLVSIREKLNIKFKILENVYEETIYTDLIVCRAFKKLKEIIRISREIVNKPHKIIVLKGKNAQSEINKVSLNNNYSYKLRTSITDRDSKIIVIEVKENEK